MRNRLAPWYAGAAVIVAAVLYVGPRMFSDGCMAPTIIQLGVLILIPLVYLTLMYLTLTSQK